MKSGRRRHPGLLPGREQAEGAQVAEQESRGCEGYPEGTNCSGVRRGLLPAHILPTHTGSQTRTHTCTHTLRPGPKCVNNPANCTPTTTTTHPRSTPHNPWRPNLESVYSDNSGAKLALLPALLVYISLS